MKTGSSRRIYWDTSVLIAWLIDERFWPNDVLTGIQDTVMEVESYAAVLFTSSITRTEFFTGQLTDEQKTKYALLMRRSNVQEVTPHQKITTRASQIREHYNQKKPSIKIKTPDAIHLATAIIYQADEFQTLDGLEKGGIKKTKLLALNSDTGVSGLRIVHPYPRTRTPANIVSIRGPLFGSQDEQPKTEQKAITQATEISGSSERLAEDQTAKPIRKISLEDEEEGKNKEVSTETPKPADKGGLGKGSS